MVIDIQYFDEALISTEDAFIIDTNVLLFIHRPQFDKENKAGHYSKFISFLRKNGCSLVVSSLNLQEAFNAIERTCWICYQESLPKGDPNRKMSRKDFRCNKAQRQKVKSAQRAFLNQIKQFYKIEPECVSENELTNYMDNLEKHQYDPIDYVISSHYGALGIITDDKDFTYDNGITVYRLQNPNVQPPI